MKKIVAVLCSFSLLLSIGSARADSSEFPHRAKFKHVTVIEIDRLHADLNQVSVVDVRTRYEFDTLHIKGATHIALHKEKLPEAVRALRTQSAKPIVFYCNGHSCKKSYEAAELAASAGIKNVFAYDAGLDTWIKKYPEQSVLLGQSPVKSSDIIDKDSFKQRLLSAAQFEAHVEKGAVVLDIRDLRQRDVALFPFKELRATLDDTQKISDAVAEAKRQKKALLVYDKVGKQTRWFQYYLEKQGLKDYYFMDGGAEGFHEAKFGKLKFQVPDST